LTSAFVSRQTENEHLHLSGWAIWRSCSTGCGAPWHKVGEDPQVGGKPSGKPRSRVAFFR
jgi:hypothetical protein